MVNARFFSHQLPTPSHEVESLIEHEDTVKDSYQRVTEKLALPVSSIKPEEIASFIHEEKEAVKDCDVDFRDGKRRVNATKAPRKTRKAADADACASSAGGSESD